MGPSPSASALFLALLLGGLGYFQFVFKPRMIKTFLASQVPPPATVTAEPARQEKWVERLSSIGTLIASQGVDITTQVAGVVTEVCVAFPALSAIAEGYEVFVVTDASGTFNDITRHSAWSRMAEAGAQLMTWFGLACELHRDWRNDIEGLGTLFSNHIPDYRNLITSYTTMKSAKGG